MFKARICLELIAARKTALEVQIAARAAKAPE
jgi:hypothetical protein